MAVRLAHGLQNRRVIAARGVLPLLNYTSLRTSGSKHVTSARFDVLLRCGERPEVWSASAWTTTPSPASWMISTMGSRSRCELLQKNPPGAGRGVALGLHGTMESLQALVYSWCAQPAAQRLCAQPAAGASNSLHGAAKTAPGCAACRRGVARATLQRLQRCLPCGECTSGEGCRCF